MDLQAVFQRNWKKNFDKYTGVLLAVSGGADSMVMAHLFLRTRLDFAVAHVNFQLRGEEADKDEQLVKDWCAANKIPFYSTRFDTQAIANEWRKGIQETARNLRYDWLEKTRAANKYSAIATAHHANDNAETLLMNLFKGTGIAGLHGIPPVNGRIIRPLLFATRKQILAYLDEEQITYREDASNASDKYLRNDVRLNVLPAIEKTFPGVVSSLNDSITRFAEAEILYKRAVEQERKKLVEQRGSDHYIPIRKLAQRQPLNTICYELFRPFGFTHGQLHDIIALLSSETGHYLSSPTHRVIRDRNFLIITKHDTRETDYIAIDTIPATFTAAGIQFKFKISAAPATIPAAENVAFINLSKLEQPLILRKWKQGDYFYPLGMGMKKKKLSRFFIDRKIPLHEKENIWVLESNKRIVWVAGHRLDERFKVVPGCEKVLVVNMGV